MQQAEHIFIIDDDPINKMVLTNILSEDHTLFHCEDPAFCIDEVKANRTDLIILDVAMGNGSGFTILEKLKKDASTYGIPVIVISGSVSFKDEARGLELGAVDYITKPFNPLIVKTRLKNHLAIKKKNDLLEKLVSLDGLTELPNRRRLDEQMRALLTGSEAAQGCFSIMLVELDFFKTFNEHYGYMHGDTCLFKVAKALEETAARYSVFIGRFDGTRFALVSAQHDIDTVTSIAQSLHDAVNALKIPHIASPICAHVSVSIGAVHIEQHKTLELNELIKNADSALAEAQKQQSTIFIKQI
ncbi:diguanylate cyclase [Pseudoalteromonas sp. McH1-7]|uniref:GGDEF domain-containing response regulator n=1 Tax=Pseudoalteromonas TaxID=53246 RepID=UPI0015923C39|nr:MULTISPECIES: diguanylate cyclase [Pseudoalteromonas]MDW7547508.1 diguanylate cyclase [Pseudoalteromonas peptidolytica]NUZ09810.1 diguanylate cyclase [Pseudoalteromonas sp. McH1-7]USD27858.1 diguanylate cyclase [Pseudoalteromonas sp. SCSIO 43201]